MANNDDMTGQIKELKDEMGKLTDEMGRLSDRVYGVEDRFDAMLSKQDVGTEALRGDFKLAFERLDGLRQFMERKADEDQKERGANQRLFYKLVQDHNRRLRALERLERRQALAVKQ